MNYLLITLSFLFADATTSVTDSQSIPLRAPGEKLEIFRQTPYGTPQPGAPSEDYYQLGRKSYEERDLDKAKKYFIEVLKKDPKNSDALLMLSYIYLWQKDPENAIKGFEQVLKDHPNYEEAKTGLKQAQDMLAGKSKGEEDSFQLGKKFYEEKNLDKAKEYFIEVLKKDPKNSDALLMLSYIYLWQNETEKAIEGFEQILKDHPDYEDAKIGLQKAKDVISGKSEEIVKKEKPAEEQAEIKFIKNLEKNIKFDTAFLQWYRMHCKYPDDLEYVYELGKIASWTGKWFTANKYLHDLLNEDNDFKNSAHLALAQQYILLWRWGKAAYHLSEFLEKDPKSGEGWLARGRMAFINRCFCDAKTYFLHSYYLLDDEDVKAIAWRDFYDTALLLAPSMKIGTLVSEDKEVDSQSEKDSARTTATLYNGRLQLNFLKKGIFFEEVETGFQRERNLVNGMRNYDVDLTRSTTGITYFYSSNFKFSGGVTIKNGKNQGTPVFPFHQKTTKEPWIAGSFSSASNSASISYAKESYIIKNFQETYSLFLQRNNLDLFLEHQILPLQSFVGISGYERFYLDSIHNKEWRGVVWVTVALPKYYDHFTLRYQFDGGGFKRTDTDYYSFKKQWEHFAIFTYSNYWPWLDLLEIRYLHSWQHSRDLNRPINTTYFLAKQFIFTNKINFMLRKVCKHGLDLEFEGQYYWDTAQYKAYLVKGNVRWIF